MRPMTRSRDWFDGRVGGRAHQRGTGGKLLRGRRLLCRGRACAVRRAGAGVEDLGLSGDVDRDAFRDLLEGRFEDKKLGTPRDGQIEHRPGWDVTLSAPKSVSVMAQVAADRVLIHADSKATNLIDQRSFYVAVSRARVAATVFTNDCGKLLSAIGERAGIAQTALAGASRQMGIAPQAGIG
jgi:hypothetical protein